VSVHSSSGSSLNSMRARLRVTAARNVPAALASAIGVAFGPEPPSDREQPEAPEGSEGMLVPKWKPTEPYRTTGRRTPMELIAPIFALATRATTKSPHSAPIMARPILSMT
jgi:hypothetical protein